VHAVNVFRAGFDPHQNAVAPRRSGFSAAASEVNTISPVAAPGEAGRPRAMMSCRIRSMVGCSKLVERRRIDPHETLHRS
jgi:hypothetical protein